MEDIKDTIRKYLDPVLGDPRIRGGQLAYECPVCGKGNTFNLEICCNESLPKRYLRFNCWGHSYHGSISDLLKDHAKDQSWKMVKELWKKKVPELVK